METVSIDEIEPTTLGRNLDRRDLSAALGTTDVAINRYRLEPGERFSGGLHAHADQEEIFVVLAGEATFETWTPDEGAGAGSERAGEGDEVTGAGEGDEVVVGAGEAVRFAPGEFQSGENSSAGELVALALGAPRDTEDLRIPLPCPDCGHVDRRATVLDGEMPALVCPDCGHESEAVCEECGSTEVGARLAAERERPVSICADCGVVSEG